MTNLVSGLLTCLFCLPIALTELSPTNCNNFDNDYRPKSKGEKIAIKFCGVILAIIAIATIPLIILVLEFAIQLFNFPIIGFIISLVLIIIPVCMWGGIIYLAIELLKPDKESKNKNKHNQIDYIVETLNNQSYNQTYNNIRKRYFDTIKNNNIIHPDIISLQKKIFSIEKSLEDVNLNPTNRSNYEDIIIATKKQIETLKLKYHKNKIIYPYKEPIIDINEVFVSTTAFPYSYSSKYIDNNIKNGDTFINDDSKKLIDKGLDFFPVNRKPIKSLKGKNVKLLFYDKFMIIEGQNDFVIVGYEDINTTYNNICIFICNEKENKDAYTPLNVSLLELCIFQNPIKIIFTKHEEGEMIHHLISKEDPQY